MNFVLVISMALLGVLSLGGVMMVLGLRNAPDGYEDENGFHYGQPAEGLVPVASTDFATCLENEMVYAGR
jgi:hypothetical protein